MVKRNTSSYFWMVYEKGVVSSLFMSQFISKWIVFYFIYQVKIEKKNTYIKYFLKWWWHMMIGNNCCNCPRGWLWKITNGGFHVEKWEQQNSSKTGFCGTASLSENQMAFKKKTTFLKPQISAAGVFYSSIWLSFIIFSVCWDIHPGHWGQVCAS